MHEKKSNNVKETSCFKKHEYSFFSRKPLLKVFHGLVYLHMSLYVGRKRCYWKSWAITLTDNSPWITFDKRTGMCPITFNLWLVFLKGTETTCSLCWFSGFLKHSSSFLITYLKLHPQLCWSVVLIHLCPSRCLSLIPISQDWIITFFWLFI